MKYAIMVSYYTWNEETQTQGEEWLYLGTEGKLKIFIFEDKITENTKLFNSAKAAGEYVDKHFGADDQRVCYKTVKIVEVIN